MTGFSEDLEQLLDAERDIDAPLPAQRARLLGRLQPLLVVPAALAVGASTTTTAASTTTATSTATQAAGGLLKAKLGAVAVSAALLGGVVGAAGHAYLAAPAPLPAASQVAPVAPAIAAPPTPEPAPVASTELAPAPVTSAAPATPSVPESSASRAPRPVPAGSLRAERLLLETASAALMRGDTESALKALRQHAQRFPSGALSEEREALLARARAAKKP